MIDNAQCQSIFGKFIRQKREELKLSQNEVASQLGISQVYYSYVEIGSRNVDLALAINICSVLDLSFDGFVRTYLEKEKIPRSQ